MKGFFRRTKFLVFVIVLAGGLYFLKVYLNENALLKEIIKRLQADSRVAQVLVTDVRFDEETKKTFTTIKFLEFDSTGKSLIPRYFTFSGNIIQFQSLVIRFDDIKIREADRLRGKSAYLFMKVFMLNPLEPQIFEIAKVNEIPDGYKLETKGSAFEKKLWEKFWKYALEPTAAKKMQIKNAQIEAPGTMFVPGTLYTIKIEHDGGLRIDAEPLPEILKGEKIEN